MFTSALARISVSRVENFAKMEIFPRRLSQIFVPTSSENLPQLSTFHANFPKRSHGLSQNLPRLSNFHANFHANFPQKSSTSFKLSHKLPKNFPHVSNFLTKFLKLLRGLLQKYFANFKLFVSFQFFAHELSSEFLQKYFTSFKLLRPQTFTRT